MSRGALAALTLPASWSSKPLWAVAPRVVEKGYPEGEPLSVYLGVGVVRRMDREDNHNELGADLSGYLHVLPGDLVFNKLRTWQGGLGVSAFEGIVSPAYFVCRPLPGVWPRFLHYLLLSAPYAAELTRVSKWMPPSQFDIPWEELRSLPIALPPMRDQQRIAEFLDSRVACIDRAIALRQRQIALLEERFTSSILEVFEEAVDKGFQPTPLKYVCDIVDTEHKTAPYVAGGGFHVAGTGAIRRGRILHERLYETDEISYREWTERAVPKVGDLLLTREAPVGQVALLRDEDLPLCIGQRVVLLRPHAGLSADLLLLLLLSPQAEKFYQEVTQGSLHPHLNMRDIGSISVPLASGGKQDQLSARLLSEYRSLEAVRGLMQESVRLLVERKRALITSAVTGEIDVCEARRVSVGV